MQKSQIHSTAGKEKAPLPPSVSFVAADGRQATTAAAASNLNIFSVELNLKIILQNQFSSNGSPECLQRTLSDSKKNWAGSTHFNLQSGQCDQMLKYKVAQKFPKVAQKVTAAVYTWKWMFSKLPKKSTHIRATCVRKFVIKNFSKIAQSGHTDSGHKFWRVKTWSYLAEVD